MQSIESLGLSAKQWQFLKAPEKYVKASEHSARPLRLESTRRQFLTARAILARLNGSCGEKACKGVLLADDVGLGKTTVAALVAWVVASAGNRGGVRILAPNPPMVRRWVDELKSHVEPLRKCAGTLGNIHEKRVKVGKVKLTSGSIQVVTQHYALSNRLTCDLLIVDEAHRAKGKGEFSDALIRQKKEARRVLILTATPFSIQLDELRRMLILIGGDESYGKVRSFSKELKKLYAENMVQNPDTAAERLAEKAKEAIEAFGRYVIRHGIDDLPNEKSSFGASKDWPIVVPPANSEELELMIRMDRTLRVAKRAGSKSSKATNDARFHVGWRHFDEERERLQIEAPQFSEPAKVVVENHLERINKLRDKVGIHSKMEAVGRAVESIIEKGEKVLLFCHHHATAQELTLHLDSILPRLAAPPLSDLSDWEKAWENVLRAADEEGKGMSLRRTFIKWLSADLIRAQTSSWLPEVALSAGLADMLRKTKCRNPAGPETVEAAAQRLYDTLLKSPSSKGVLRTAEASPGLLPGANGTSRVLGVCPAIQGKEPLFLRNKEPDTIISIFNSPFGPDVLVVTDSLSEGIDLHRYCRCLIHYELDPSPIRTVQRNGRLRRVNSWAAATGEKILYAYPAFLGTRDHRLVQIMKKRIDSFSLLLGGVQDFNIDDVAELEEKRRNEVIALAKNRLKTMGGLLRAREPGGASSTNSLE